MEREELIVGKTYRHKIVTNELFICKKIDEYGDPHFETEIDDYMRINELVPFEIDHVLRYFEPVDYVR